MALPPYTAYGLSIVSDLALPELEMDARGEGLPLSREGEAGEVPESLESNAAPDVRVVLGAALEPRSFEADCDDLRSDLHVGKLAWRGVGRFSLQRGRRVLVEPQAEVPEPVLRVFLLGPTLATLLFQRGFLVLHASAVALPNLRGEWGAVAFLGRSGEGKSTMAAALHARGGSLVADDYIAVPPLPAALGNVASHGSGIDGEAASSTASAHASEATGAHPFLFPGYAQMRLWPQSLAALGESTQAPSPVSSHFPKIPRHAARGFSTRRLPLRHVYVLEEGDDVSIRPLPPARSIVELGRHCYCTSLLAPQESAAQFELCGALAGAVRVRLLQRPRDLTRLAEVAQAVEDDQRV